VPDVTVTYHVPSGVTLREAHQHIRREFQQALVEADSRPGGRSIRPFLNPEFQDNRDGSITGRWPYKLA